MYMIGRFESEHKHMDGIANDFAQKSHVNDARTNVIEKSLFVIGELRKLTQCLIEIIVSFGKTLGILVI